MTMVKNVVKTVPAAQFKANCSKWLDEIDRDGITVIVTKRGVPTAKLVPVDSEGRRRDGDRR